MANQRTALLIRCSEEEAQAIRSAAAEERRTVSGFVLYNLMRVIRLKEEIKQKASARTAPWQSWQHEAHSEVVGQRRLHRFGLVGALGPGNSDLRTPDAV